MLHWITSLSKVVFNRILEEILKGLADKAKQGECWTSVAPLLYWKKHQTIRDQLDKKWEDLKKTYGNKVHFIPKLSKLAFGSGNDDVHLVDKSRERFFNHVLESSISYFVMEKTDETNTTEERFWCLCIPWFFQSKPFGPWERGPHFQSELRVLFWELQIEHLGG